MSIRRGAEAACRVHAHEKRPESSTQIKSLTTVGMSRAPIPPGPNLRRTDTPTQLAKPQFHPQGEPTGCSRRTLLRAQDQTPYASREIAKMTILGVHWGACSATTYGPEFTPVPTHGHF